MMTAQLWHSGDVSHRGAKDRAPLGASLRPCHRLPTETSPLPFRVQCTFLCPPLSKPDLQQDIFKCPP